MKLIGDVQGKVFTMGLPIASDRWLDIRYSVQTSGITKATATNSTSITISNASEKTITVTFPKPLEAKEDKP